MVPEYEVVLYLNDALLVLGVVLLDQQEEFSLNRGLIVVLLLILDEFHGDHGLRFVIETLEHLTESTLADLLYDLETEAYLVIL